MRYGQGSGSSEDTAGRMVGVRDCVWGEASG